MSPEAWNALSVESYPFLSHAFLKSLEQHGCLGRSAGWFPSHVLCENDDGRLVGALPMYLKSNSFGEFVFDWSWAQRTNARGSLLSQAVVASPFTPANGPRLLAAAGADRSAVAQVLIDSALAVARKFSLSSVHWLFGVDPELASHPELLAARVANFIGKTQATAILPIFLDTLTAKRRKEIKRERRQALDGGITVERIHGDQADGATWQLFHRLYRRTFAKHGNHAALTRTFFAELDGRWAAGSADGGASRE